MGKGDKPMTNYNERLDEILKDHREWMRGVRTDRLVGTSSAEAKQAIKALIANQVREELTNLKIARLNLGTITTDHADGYQMAVDDMNRHIENRIKELEESK
jgi:acyl-CoA hydrolase